MDDDGFVIIRLVLWHLIIICSRFYTLDALYSQDRIMRIITGDEMGLLKATSLESKQIVVGGKQTRDRSILASCWTRSEGNNNGIFALARADGTVTLWQDAPKVRGL